MTLSFGSDKKVSPYLTTRFPARFSRDAHWVVYSSDESGRNEVYVRPFPDANGGKWMISNGGGSQPRWRGDGREIVYVSQEGRLMAVKVGAGPVFRPSAPEPLFQVGIRAALPAPFWTWDVTADGKLFVAAVEPQSAGNAPITVVLDWQAALKR
jgi:hypothetical protein